MVGIIKEIDGQKKIVPLTTDTGTGAPVGTLITQYKKVPMSGYLYCDGSTFDENDYPALYMYLGTNVLPDYRECVMVGAERNTTDTIATHDVYGEGEFKDDQLQRITGSFEVPNRNRAPNTSGAFSVSESDTEWFALDQTKTLPSKISFDSSTTARTGDTNTTHGKQKAVYVYIKATSGLAENQQENVLNDAKNYIQNAFKLSPVEDFTLTTTNQTIQYDGILFLRTKGNNNVVGEIYINDVKLIVTAVVGSDEDTVVLPVCKGDTFRINKPDTIWTSLARWYKNR